MADINIVQYCGSGIAHRQCPQAGVSTMKDGRLCLATASKHAICSYSAWLQPTSITPVHDLIHEVKGNSITSVDPEG